MVSILWFGACFFTISSVALSQSVHGTVEEAKSGEPLPGVNVIVKGTTTGTSTDADGIYELNVSSSQDTLVFSFVGYQQLEIPINGRTSIDVALQAQAVTGEEMVVIGYGTLQRSDLTGSVGSVDASDMNQQAASNVSEALSGKISGVDISLSSGAPGGKPNIRVRGSTSVSNTNDPLFVVDGVIMSVEDMQGGISPINSIPPGSIESIEVLKDASATAIYGSRGANGVVIITTKKGQEGKVRIDYNGSVSVGTASKKIGLLNSAEFLEVEEIAYKNAEKYDPEGFAGGKYTDPIEKRKAFVINNQEGNPELFDENLNPIYDTDWQDVAFRNAVTHNHDFSISGGDKGTTYAAFLSYRDEDGVMTNSWLKRYSARLNLQTEVNDWLNFGGSISYSNQEQREPDGWASRMLYESIPIIPVKYPDGTWAGNEDYPGMEGGANQQRISENSFNKYINQNIIAKFNANIEFSDYLEFKTLFGANIISQEGKRYSGNTLKFISRDQDGTASITSANNNDWQFENTLTYSRDIHEVHSIEALLGQSIESTSMSNSGAAAWGFLDNELQYYNLGIASNPRPPSSGKNKYTMASFFGRLNYVYNDKYLFTATGRVDGSSRFGKNSRYAFFPSGAIGWRISEEQFMRDISFISDLKVRASYGHTGNSEIANYQYQALLGTYTAIFNGNRYTGVGVDRLANPDLKWEINKQFDIGLELGLFSDRIFIEADIYRRKSQDMLLNRPLPTTSGFSSVFENIGSMENRGLELSLSTNNIVSEHFNWSTDFNLSINRNKVLHLHGGSDIRTAGNTIVREGLPVNTFMGYVRMGTWGLDEAEEASKYNRFPGDLKYKDVNNDGAINQDDEVPIGNGIPDGYGSFINTFSYKNFRLSADIQFMYGNDVMWRATHSTEDRVGIANSLTSVLNAWTPNNQNTPIAQLRPTEAGYDTNFDSHILEDGSFIRGRNFTLSYNFPAELLDSWSINNLRIYVSGRNLFTITKFRGYDPEVSTSGSDFTRGLAEYFEYPKARTFLLGFNISL